MADDRARAPDPAAPAAPDPGGPRPVAGRDPVAGSGPGVLGPVASPHLVASADGQRAAEDALAFERAAVWVGEATGPAYDEFRSEIVRPP